MAKRKSFWGDARFFIGLALIGVSVAGVWGVVASARQTVPVFVAGDTMVPGQEVTAADLDIVEASLGAADERYLAPGDDMDGLFAQRTVGAGEIVPLAAVSTSTETTTIVVASAAEVPASVAAGSPVELWVAPAIDGGYGTPRILVADAVVAEVARGESTVASADVSVELAVGRSSVADVLAAIASESALSVVPIGSAG